MKLLTIFSLLSLLLIICECKSSTQQEPPSNAVIKIQLPDSLNKWERYFLEQPTYRCDGFDFPVGKPNAEGYYNAQPFQSNNHLGDDWNAVTGGNSDLGDPIYAIANGYVVLAQDKSGGWGNVIRVMHQLDDSTYVESIYAHCDTMLVSANKGIKRGQQIATIGNAGGIYYAHLHLEIRDSVEMDLGGGYSSYYTGFLDPTAFINKHRP